MAWDKVTDLIGMTTSSDLSAKQYYMVKLASTDRAISIVSATTDAVWGVLYNEPEANETAQVAYRIGDIVKLKCYGAGSAIAVGNLIGPSSSGIGVKLNTSTCLAFGKALEGTSGTDSIIPVEIIKRPMSVIEE